MKSSEVAAIIKYIEQSNQAGFSKDDRLAQLVEKLSQKEHDREISGIERRLTKMEDSLQQWVENGANAQTIVTNLAVLSEKVEAQKAELDKRPDLLAMQEFVRTQNVSKATIASAVIAALALMVSAITHFTQP